MSRARPYLRPVEPLWWARPPYLTYTLREATGVAVAGYALVLLAGLIALAAGEGAYGGWFNLLQSRWSLTLHVLFLVGMLGHVWTWFQIMPKTMPRLAVGNRIVPQSTITAAGLALAIAAFFVALLFAGKIQP